MHRLENIDPEVESLIIRFLDGSAADSDLVRLQGWMSASEENLIVFNEMRRIWIECGLLTPYNEHKGWEKVCYRMEQSERIAGKYRLMRIMGYAAAIVLLLCGSIYLLSRTAKVTDSVVPELAENTILPGSKRAVLVLGSNEQVELGVGKDTVFGEDAIMNKNNTLLYTGDKTVDTKEVFNTLITPRGGEYSVVLSDGTKVWINAESELRYPVHFSGSERIVYLKGEAYFDVKKQEGKTFIVCSGESKVTVLGTEFNVRNYQGEEVAATLVRGSVLVADGRNNERRLIPGQQARLTKEGIEVNAVEMGLYTAWKDGYFVYRETTLDEILKGLSRWYDFTYFYQNQEAANGVLTAKLKKFDSADRIFKILEETGEFKFERKGKTVIVKSVR